MSRILVASLSLLAAVAWPLDGAADANIVVDGSFGDWPADCWGFQDVGGDNPPPYADIQELRLTNNNASGSDGNLFVGVDFFNTFNYNIGNHDVDVWLYLDIDGDGRTDGAADRAIELTEQQVFDGTGALVGTFSQSTAAGDRLEAGIPYSLLGLTHGADTFGVSFAVTGHPNNVEYSPEPGDASDGMLIYDGTQGDGIEPLAVRLLALQAAPAPGGVELTWVTASERRNAGFHLLRASPGGRPVRLTAAPVPGLIDAPVGRLYRYLDPEGRTGDTYLLEDVEIGGARHRHPPVVAGASRASLASPRAATRVEPPRAPRVRRPRLASGEVAQLAVPQAGLLRLGGAQLAALGLSAQNTALTRASGAVPVLRDGDGLVFVGAPSRDRHAELEVVRAAPGRPLAMPARGVDGACAKPAGALTEQVWIEREREYYVAAPGEDPFFWGSAFPGYPLSLEFDLPGLQPGAGELALRVAGLGAGPHRLLLTLGACDLGEAAWGGDALSELVVPVPAGCLAERGNRLDLALPPDGAWDGVFADGLGVLHARRLRAVAGVLELSARPGSCLELTGLGVAGARLVEVSDPLRPVELRGAAVGPGADGTGVLRFADPGDPAAPPRRYLAVASGAAGTPGALPPAASCALRDPALGADYLLITHPDFLAAAQRLAGLHAARGLAVRVVTTREAYDCFSFGRPGPEGIRVLLDTALTSWSRAPRYALLLGGATVDPRGFLDGSPPDFLPAPFARLGAFGYESPSDGWYAAGPDGVSPRLALGRLPVQSLAEAEALVDKLERALSGASAPTGRWGLAADDREPGASEPTELYQALAWELWRECGPDGATPVKVFKSGLAEPRAALAAEAEAGLDALLYFGHAFLSGWSSSPMMADLALAAGLRNARPFVLLSFTCFDGAFVGPWAESLAWGFVRNPAGGALAATAAATLSDPSALRRLSLALACGLARERAGSLGQVFQAALASLAAGSPAERDMARAYHLLGDPATPVPGR